MSYTPPAYTDAGGSLASGYMPPAFTDAGGDVDPPPPVPPGPLPLPRTSLALPVIVAQLTIDGATEHYSDIEYGDAYTRWHDARIVGDVAYSRSVSCVLWGERRGANGLGNVELINTDGALDSMLVASQADASIAVYVVDQDQPMSAATQIASAVVTGIEARGEQTARVVAGDIMARLEIPLQSDLYAAGDGAATIVGRPKPIAIGNPLSCPVVLVNEVDYEYDCHDSDAFDIVTVRDMGFPLALGTDPGDGYRIADPPRTGIELLQTPVGRVVADVSATTFASESIIGAAEGDFATDILDWTLVTSTTGGGTASATWDAGTALLEVDGTGATMPFPYLDFSFPTALEAGQSYSYALDVDVTVSAAGQGLVQVQFRPDSLAAPEYVQLLVTTSTGTHALSGTFVAPSAGKLFIRVSAVADESATAVVDNVRLDRVGAGGDVADVVELLLARAGIGSSQIDADSIAALRAARPWAVSYWADSAERVGDVLQRVLDSVYGWMFVDRLGRISVGYLQPPETGTPELEITTTELAGEIEIEPDLAPGLSTTVAGARNWYRYGEGELADAISDADRALLTADYRIRRTATDPVGIELRDRAGAAVSSESDTGIATLLDDATDIQAAADYLADLYPAGLPRRFYKVPVFLSRIEAATLNPGDLITLTYDRFGCDAGRPLRVVAVEGIAGDDLVNLRCWGSAVEE
jgi:hypothetical protein